MRFRQQFSSIPQEVDDGNACPPLSILARALGFDQGMAVQSLLYGLAQGAGAFAI